MYSTCNKRLHQPNRRRCRRNMWHPCKVLFSCLTSDPIHTSAGRCWISYSFLRMGMHFPSNCSDMDPLQVRHIPCGQQGLVVRRGPQHLRTSDDTGLRTAAAGQKSVPGRP